MEIKESEKLDKYLDLARELKNLRNIRVTVILIFFGALGTVLKALGSGLNKVKIGGRIETVQIMVVLRSTRILRRVLETWGDLLSFTLQ